jgi:hypothetical protein
MTDVMSTARDAIRVHLPSPPPMQEVEERVRRRARRRTTRTAALASVAVVLAGIGIVATRSPVSTRPAVVATAAKHWLAVPRPARFPHLLTSSPGTTRASPRLVAVSHDQSKTISVRRLRSDEVAEMPFSESIAVGGRTGSITTDPVRGDVHISVELGDAGDFVNVTTIGLSEKEALGTVTAWALLDPAPTDWSELRLPEEIEPFVPVDDSDVVTTAVYGDAALRFVAFVTVSRTRRQALARLHEHFGALTPTMVNERDVLVGSRATGPRGQTSVAAVDTGDGHTVTVTGGGDGSEVDDLIRLALNTRLVDEATLADARSEQQNAERQNPDDCMTPPADRTLTVDLTGYNGRPSKAFRSLSSANNPGVCVTNSSSGAELRSIDSGQILGGGDGGSWTVYGIVDAGIARVRLELSDGSIIDVATYAVPDFPHRVWLIGFASAPRYRAFEQLDSTGTVVSRAGRPAR